MKRELDEIEVDITAPKPLNKKQKRLLKKGKIEEPKPVDLNATQPKPRSQFSVWIGNLSFETNTEKLRSFLIESTKDLTTKVTNDNITRIKLPSRKGFAYVDVQTEEQMNQLIKLSESRLDNRNLLIKAANSFEGRPEEHANGQKNPPSRILFVGNLSFDTTDEQLEMQFQHCGEIRRIRTATFQDTGKCKGFTFIDFKTEEAATNAIKDKSCHKMHGRSLRLEYGEDRSQRRPKSSAENNNEGLVTSTSPMPSNSTTEPASTTQNRQATPGDTSTRPRRPKAERKPRVGTSRPTPGAALSNAARGKQSIVPSQGKKMTFE